MHRSIAVRARPRARGLTLMEMMVIIAVISVLLGVLIPAIQASREAARRSQCVGNLKQIALAFHNYEAVWGVLPPGAAGGGPAGSRWSTQVVLLPYVERNSLYSSMNFAGVPWGHDPVWSPMNLTALQTPISNFVCPSDTDAIPDPGGLGHNTYRAAAGSLPVNLALGSPGGAGANDGMFFLNSSLRFKDIVDGMSVTVAFSERCLGTGPNDLDLRADYLAVQPPAADCARPGQTPRRWTNPVEWSGQRWADGNAFYTRYQHIRTPNSVSCTDGADDYDGATVITPSSRHPGGVNVALADGSVHFIKDKINPAPWKGLGTIAGDEPLVIPWYP